MPAIHDTKMEQLDGEMIAVSEGALVNRGGASVEEPATNGGRESIIDDGPQVNGHVEFSGKPIETQVLVIGAGLSGISAMYKLGKAGLKYHTFEAGSEFGGVWHWNRYPGARVDSEVPFYQLNIPEVWRKWSFSERFPDHNELREYCAFVAKTLDLDKHVDFNARVIGATWDDEKGIWTVKTNKGHTAMGKYLILGTGVLHREYTPDFPGLSQYQGKLIHSGSWPKDLEVKGKKIGLVGSGATAVQITQELGKQAEKLTVFLRRPSYCFPMQQRSWSDLENKGWKAFLDALFKQGRLSRTGFPNGGTVPCGVFDVSKEEREELWEELWARGAFNFSLSNYNDVVTDRKANREVYDFWARKVRERMPDSKKASIMAPTEPPFFFGTKRPPLEQDYYEVLSQSNVDLVDLNKTPLKTFHPKGMIMEDDQLREFDIVVLATGFDSFRGSACNMGLKDKHGVDMKEIWGDSIRTYLGVMTSGFPNMFMSYGPQAPSVQSNGTTIIEVQLDFCVDAIVKLEKENVRSIEPLAESEKEWKDLINKMADMTLLPLTNSWWTGNNIPGRKAETLSYVGGLNNYEPQIRSHLDDWKGFEIIKAN